MHGFNCTLNRDINYNYSTAVRSGDYYLFDDQALTLDEKELELEEKMKKSFIPDPEGDELRKIANLRGISAVSIRTLSKISCCSLTYLSLVHESTVERRVTAGFRP